MMRRTLFLLSPKRKRNQHPRNAVRWKPNTSGFYKPHMGASKMKWHFTLPYDREQPQSLFHYPEVSRITGKPVDWYHQEPMDGYDATRIYGDHTLELKGMPMGRTPEYMQERLRRFFSKFGPVKHCRAEPHPLDPYQCEGTAFVTFRDREASMKALRAPLKFPASLHDKVVSMKHLDVDKHNDPEYYEKAKFWNGELLSLAKQLHEMLATDAGLRARGLPISSVGLGLLEHELVAPPQLTAPLPGRGGIPPSKGGLAVTWEKRLVPARVAVAQRFGSWEAFLAEPPLDELFKLDLRRLPSSAPVDQGAVIEEVPLAAGAAGEVPAPAEPEEGAEDASRATLVVLPRLVSSAQRARILMRTKNALDKRLQNEMSVWWREGKVPLPDYTQSRITWWDHAPKLPESIQIMSRHRNAVRRKFYDEKYLYRQQLTRARAAKRAERRTEWKEERRQELAEKQQQFEERRRRAFAAVEQAKCERVLGISEGLVPPNAHMVADMVHQPEAAADEEPW